MQKSVVPIACVDNSLSFSSEISPPAFENIRRMMLLHHCKWDPQIGDVCSIAPFALLLARSAWRELSELAERLTIETLNAEIEIAKQPRLIHKLGLPARIAKLLEKSAEFCGVPAPRIMRFDFHPTTEGWRLSEVNSDVPGGYTESSFLPALFAKEIPYTRVVGNPAAAFADAFALSADKGDIGLLFAPKYMEDIQIVVLLAKLLTQRGCAAHIISPNQLYWKDGKALIKTADYTGPIAALFRFFQGEWFTQIRGSRHWRPFFQDLRIPVSNARAALLSESKRFPLVWDEIKSDLSTWRSVLPETLPFSFAKMFGDSRWVFKKAFSNNGDSVLIPKITTYYTPKMFLASFERDKWCMQKRFHVTPISSPRGPMYPCIGVYTLDGKAVGAYGRIAAKPIIDYQAIDVSILEKVEG